jgi:hypothetical protein
MFFYCVISALTVIMLVLEGFSPQFYLCIFLTVHVIGDLIKDFEQTSLLWIDKEGFNHGVRLLGLRTIGTLL